MKVSPQIRAFLRRQGQEGGHARAKSLTAARRREIAVKAAAARWTKAKKTAA